MLEKVNNWKILSYVIFTWLGISIISQTWIYYHNSDNPEKDLMLITNGLYVLTSIFLGFVMAYKFNKKIEIVYGFLFGFVVVSILMSISLLVGIPVALYYFGSLYKKLEYQRLGNGIPEKVA